AKTGWGMEGEMDYGWFVGWLEKDGRTIYFATNIEAEEPEKNFYQARMDITYEVLDALGWRK
ncbi:MAG: penicillin-binding transpeptidase domain-containing protein, partial [Bacteroidota bacterium]